MILERYRQAVADRSPWLNTFSEVGRYVWPNASTMIKSVQTENEGQVLTVDIPDSTAIKAAYRMTSGIVSYLMPVGTKWFDFKPTDPVQLKNREILKRASEATELTQSAIWRSNFIREMFMTIRSMVVFGTGCVSVELVKGKLVYRNYHIGDIFFEENADGEIDTVFRRMFRTARQLKQQFGETNLSVSVKQALANEDFSTKFEIVHCVYPRVDYDDRKLDKKPFVSEYYEIQSEQKIKEGGLDDVTYKIGRLDRSPDELMGRSPGIELLPDIKMLCDMRYTFLLASEMAARPPILVEDDGVVGQPATGPGDVITVRSGAMEPKPLQTGANPQLTAEVINGERQAIYEGFFNYLFQPLFDKQNMTAYEVQERKDEGWVMLAPTMSGPQKELFDPIITRSMKLVVGKDTIGADVDIVYHGRLAMATSNMQTMATEIWAAKWSPYQQFFPVLDNVNLDKAAANSALNMGVQADLVRSEDEVADIRENTQRMEDARKVAELAEVGSKAIKNLQGTGL